MNDIRQKKNELLEETWKLKRACFELSRNNRSKKNYDRAIELRKKEEELWKKKMFYEKFLEEMEKEEK